MAIYSIPFICIAENFGLLCLTMESLNTGGEQYLSPTLRGPEEWLESLRKPEIKARFDELVDWTQTYADAEANPWVLDRNEVAGRWQHAADMLAHNAAQHSYPLFEGGGWGNKEWAAEVLRLIDQPEDMTSFSDIAIVLTHSYMMRQTEPAVPGLTTEMFYGSFHPDSQELATVEHNTIIVDLRDMGEPTVSILGIMTAEQYAALSQEQRDTLRSQLSEAVEVYEHFGKGYSWINGTPQEQLFWDESRKLDEYQDLAEFGTTERDEIWRISNERKAAQIAALRAERSDFGKTPDGFADLPEEVKEAVGDMFEYFDSMRDPFDQIVIDSYTLGHAETSEEVLQELLDKNILANPRQRASLGGVLWYFDLSDPYYECWVSRHYLSETDTE